jgi:hypothetical protein
MICGSQIEDRKMLNVGDSDNEARWRLHYELAAKRQALASLSEAAKDPAAMLVFDTEQCSISYIDDVVAKTGAILAAVDTERHLAIYRLPAPKG